MWDDVDMQSHLIVWWESHRPPGWDLVQHLEQPAVGCVLPADRSLAAAIAYRIRATLENVHG